MGAPVGSLIVRSKDKITKARRKRKIFGGGMRQVGIIASAGLYAIKNHFPLLKEDHLKARKFAETLNNSEYFSVDLKKTQTNLVFIKVLPDIEAKRVEEECLKNGLHILALGPKDIRAVFHFQISGDQAKSAADIMIQSIEKLI